MGLVVDLFGAQGDINSLLPIANIPNLSALETIKRFLGENYLACFKIQISHSISAFHRWDQFGDVPEALKLARAFLEDLEVSPEVFLGRLGSTTHPDVLEMIFDRGTFSPKQLEEFLWALITGKGKHLEVNIHLFFRRYPRFAVPLDLRRTRISLIQAVEDIENPLALEIFERYYRYDASWCTYQ